MNNILTTLLCLLVVGGLIVELCWMRNIIRQTLRDEELMDAFRKFGRFIRAPFRSMGASLDQQFNTLVDRTQVVFWPKKKEDRQKR